MSDGPAAFEMATPRSADVLDVPAVQLCVAAEHAAVYGYGVLGGRLAGLPDDGTSRGLAQRSYDAHRATRDALAVLVQDLGGDPEPAEPAYQLPFVPDTLARCQWLGRYLEDRCAEAYASGVAQSGDGARVVLAGFLGSAAVRAVDWGGEVTAFPGRPDL